MSKKKSLSDKDIRYLLGYDCPIYLYSELNEFSSIDDLLNPDGECVILFEDKPNSGHWTCLCRSVDMDNQECINFFDSYNFQPDQEKKYIPDDFMEMNNMVRNILTEMLYDYPLKIEYNEKKLQKMKKGINTCGRHVCCRLWTRDQPLDLYQKFMTSGRMSPDDKVTRLTDSVFNGQFTPDEMSYNLSKLISSLEV